jgi:hypothetical protein
MEIFDNESLFDFDHEWLLAYRDDAMERFTVIRTLDECDFGLYSSDVMYRGHIIAQYKNRFDIANIDGNRRVRTFFRPISRGCLKSIHPRHLPMVGSTYRNENHIFGFI